MLPPTLPPRLPPLPPPPLPLHIKAARVAFNTVKVELGGTTHYMTRMEAFRFLGELERAAGES